MVLDRAPFVPNQSVEKKENSGRVNTREFLNKMILSEYSSNKEGNYVPDKKREVIKRLIEYLIDCINEDATVNKNQQDVLGRFVGVISKKLDSVTVTLANNQNFISPALEQLMPDLCSLATMVNTWH